MGKATSILMMVILVLCALPFLSPEVKIEWTTYFGIPLVILLGSAGVTFITRRFEAIIVGMVISIILPAFLG